MNRHYKTLELDKMLDHLAGLTNLPDAKEMALALEPQTDIEKVRLLLQQTDDAVALSGRFGAPSFGGASNCAGILRRAEAGGCLSAGELLKIAYTLRIIRTVKEWHSRCASVETKLDGYFSGLISNKYLDTFLSSCFIINLILKKSNELRRCSWIFLPILCISSILLTFFLYK